MRSLSRLCVGIGLALTACLGGCHAIGVVADKVVGPQPVKARYTFSETTPVLVLVENYREPSGAVSDGQRIARMVGEVLSKRNAAVIISQEKLAFVRDSRPSAFASMSVIEIGKAVGAHQVLYVDLGGIGVGAAQGSDILKGVANANVRVIDVSTGRIAFPVEMADGYPVEVASPMRRSTEQHTPNSVRGETLVLLSTNIARLFYTYQPGDLESLETGF